MSYSWTCPACGISARVPATTPRIFCACGYRQLNGPTPGLGDYVAAGLRRIGITERRYRRVKRVLGLKGTCGCGRRQARLNEIGRKLSITR